MTDKNVSHGGTTEYRVLKHEGGQWSVLATGFTGLLCASRWLYDTLGKEYPNALRLERRAPGQDWVRVYTIIPGDYPSEVLPC